MQYIFCCAWAGSGRSKEGWCMKHKNQNKNNLKRQKRCYKKNRLKDRRKGPREEALEKEVKETGDVR